MSKHVWIIDDDQSIRWVLEKTFTAEHYQVSCFETAARALEALEDCTPDLIFSDIRMPNMDGLTLTATIKQKHPDLPIIIMTAHSDLDAAVASFQHGAYEYLPKPFDIDKAVELAHKAMSQKETDSSLPSTHLSVERHTRLIGKSPAMQDVFRIIGRLSQTHIAILINGESGTGKELIAKALHQHSPRKDKPFIALNMAAIPKELIESELFGHEKGSFTGAATQRQGRFEQAHHGTLFLDEIGDMPLEAQTRLLRVLSENEFYRVGGQTAIKVNVRIIAATHQNLEALVHAGLFRADLFHRLNVIRMNIPALRERSEDIPELIHYFLKRASAQQHIAIKTIHSEAMRLLTAFHWPGNVRQLENTCSWLTVMTAGTEVLVKDLPKELVTHTHHMPASSVVDIQLVAPTATTVAVGATIVPASTNINDDWSTTLAQWVDAQLHAGEPNVMDRAQEVFDKVVIETALKFTKGQRNIAAEKLGIGRNTITRKLKDDPSQ